MNWRKVRRNLAISLGLGLAICLIVAWFVGGALVAPNNRPVGRPPTESHAVATTLASDSGSRIATWYIPSANAQATIVLLHPIHADRRAMLGRARLYHDAGYAVVMIDFQAHGESPGDYITVGHLEQHDARAAVEYARKMNPTHKIGIDGWSLGGAAAVMASPLGVDAMVLESVYPTISEAVRDRIAMRLGPLSYVLSPVLLTGLQIRCGISPSDLRPIDHVAEVGCPILMLAGDADQLTTLAETERLLDAAKEPKKLIIFEGAAHEDFLEKGAERFREEVLPFFAAHLNSPSGKKQ